MIDKKDKEELFLENMKLVPFVIRYKLNVTVVTEDLLQIGYLGLWKAVLNYNSDKENNFSTFAIRCIKNQLLMEYRKLTNNKNKANFQALSLDSQYQNENGDGNEFYSFLNIEDNSFEDKLDFNLILEIFEKLNPNERERLIFNQVVFYGTSQEKLANYLNISRSQVCRIINKIYKKIRKELDIKV